MKIRFNLNYTATAGQRIFLFLKDRKGIEKSFEMFFTDTFWTKKVEWSSDEKLFYRYFILNKNGELENEETDFREVILIDEKTTLYDEWKYLNGNSVFRSKLFSHSLFKRKKTTQRTIKQSDKLLIQLEYPRLEPHQYVAIVGNQEQLGNWDLEKKVRLNEKNFPFLQVSLSLSEISFPLEYKYVVVDTQNNETVVWENGKNRKIDFLDSQQMNIITDYNIEFDLPKWKASGVAIPVFSLRSEESFGIGEFLDLKKMIDWAKLTGQKIIQTLPINDTTLHRTNKDSYPYNAVSVYALHPIYLRLEALGILKNKKEKQDLEKKKKELNAKSFVDYKNVLDVKWDYFEKIYKQEKETVFASKEYQKFYKKNSDWLMPYAVFSYLRDENRTPNFLNWKEYNTYNKAEIEQLLLDKRVSEKVGLYFFLQYHLHVQLLEVKKYAEKNGVALKGDIPIGVSPLSVDVWAEPELFNTQTQAGAPPDDFSAIGQNWVFPTYNWEQMKKNGYAWWSRRFAKFEEYFDAYRIDHILGFFRIWEIPQEDIWALKGSFYPAMPYFPHDLQQKGLHWNEKRFTEPYIDKEYISTLFHENTEKVLQLFFEKDKYDRIVFKSEFDTQRKIENSFQQNKKPFGSDFEMVKKGLFELNCNVLFVRDNRNENLFHPRISVHSSNSFKALSQEQQQILDAIYVDYFYHRHNEFWKQKAYEKLPAIKGATQMLSCAEDLGMVPNSVAEVLQNLEILSLEIQRMPKKSNQRFGVPCEYPYLSVCTTSTHDMNPIRAWWKEDKATTEDFYYNVMGGNEQVPQNCSGKMAEKIVKQHLQSNSMFTILPLQDWLAMDENIRLQDEDKERINTPSNPDNFWSYRMHLTLNELVESEDLNKKIREMVRSLV